MESTSFTQEFSSGRLVLRRSCHADRETMDALAEGNRFCHSCKKVVHNLVGMSEAEIKALFQANAGKLCGAISLPSSRIKPEIRLIAPLSKVTYWKKLAATASFLLLYQGMQTAPSSPRKSTTWIAPDTRNKAERIDPVDWSQNTLVSGVVLAQDSLEIGLDFQVYIYVNKALVAKSMAHGGFLRIDLGGKVKPESTIEIVIPKNSAYDPDYPEGKQTHGGFQKTLRLRDAQNLPLVVQYSRPMMMLGDMGWEEIDAAPQGDLPVAPVNSQANDLSESEESNP